MLPEVSQVTSTKKETAPVVEFDEDDDLPF
jgi:hypothetical protein